MRSAEQLLLVATDEARLLATATELLGEEYGYGARYVVLHDARTAELYVGGAAGKNAGAPPIQAHPRPEGAGLLGARWATAAVGDVRGGPAGRRSMGGLPPCRP